MTTPSVTPGGGGVISSGGSDGESVPILFHLQALREGDALLADERERRFEELDRRYQDRFLAQEQAMSTALIAADKAVAAALIAAEKAVATALEAAARSADKLSEATAERFASVNEFRGQLADQTAQFPSRSDLSALSVQIVDVKDRLTRIEAARLGGRETREDNRNQNAALYAAIGIVITILLAVVTIAGFALSVR